MDIGLLKTWGPIKMAQGGAKGKGARMTKGAHEGRLSSAQARWTNSPYSAAASSASGSAEASLLTLTVMVAVTSRCSRMSIRCAPRVLMFSDS